MLLKLIRKSANTWLFIFYLDNGLVLTWHQGGKAFLTKGDECLVIYPAGIDIYKCLMDALTSAIAA